VALVVADTGSGIPPAELERIFERFYRVDASRARASGGFGLGLAIVYDLVTAMGGTISVESKVGEGSVFRVVLPVAVPAAAEQPPEPLPPEPAAIPLPQLTPAPPAKQHA
jgi:two-component system OmpR family sensor kinase